MRVLFLLVLSLPLLVSGSLHAQSLGTLWFVQAGAGAGAHDNGPFSRRLQSYTPRQAGGERFVYKTEEISNVGYSLGGAAGYILASGLLLGASGETVMFPTFRSIGGLGSERDEYSLGGWEAGLDVGWRVLDEDETVVYPFAHLGYAGYSLEYANHQADSIPFFEGNPVAPGATGSYSGAAPRAAIGIGMNSILGGATTGLLVGARVTYGRMVSWPLWEQDGEAVNNGGHTPWYHALTLSLAIGVGGSSR